MNYSLSFGGKHNFCVTAGISADTPTKCYVDRVEYNESCIKDGILEERGGIIKLVKAALWTIIQLIPSIEYITLKDDSHIYCEKGSKLYKLNLAYDYILKYNKTWYEKHFNAIIYNKDNYNAYKKSLNMLDASLNNIEFIVDKIPYLEKYREIYNISLSPRDFINNLRKVYSKTYCFEVGAWLTSYMELLDIKYYWDMWCIYKNTIKKPDNFTINPTNSIRGGNRTNIKYKNYRLMPSCNSSESCIGYYDTFE